MSILASPNITHIFMWLGKKTNKQNNNNQVYYVEFGCEMPKPGLVLKSGTFKHVFNSPDGSDLVSFRLK